MRIVFLIFILILVALLARYWKGTQAVTSTFLGGVTKLTAQLQNPGGYPS